jgi:hypothetical protein
MDTKKDAKSAINSNAVAGAGTERASRRPYRDQTAVLVELAAEYSRAHGAARTNGTRSPAIDVAARDAAPGTRSA